MWAIQDHNDWSSGFNVIGYFSAHTGKLFATRERDVIMFEWTDKKTNNSSIHN